MTFYDRMATEPDHEIRDRILSTRGAVEYWSKKPNPTSRDLAWLEGTQLALRTLEAEAERRGMHPSYCQPKPPAPRRLP